MSAVASETTRLDFELIREAFDRTAVGLVVISPEGKLGDHFDKIAGLQLKRQILLRTDLFFSTQHTTTSISSRTVATPALPKARALSAASCWPGRPLTRY